MLIRQPLGTFLLRFSDSEIGGITIAWTGEKEVLNLAPFVGKDFNIRGLPDRIRDVKDLVNLFPNKPKDEVFSKYYTSTSENVNVDGYIRPVLMTTLPQKFTFSKEIEIKQPFSQESSYDVNLNSVQNMDDSPYAQYIEVPDDFIEMEIAPYTTDYRPEDIDEINIEELISNHQLSG
uniref:SH2 domain-containing protein n=3 Tax=Arion vulgaris TaxID=1028688 RepID=A0A0B7B1L0_9EUPU